MEKIHGINDWRLSTDEDDTQFIEKISNILNNSKAYRMMGELFKNEGLPASAMNEIAHEIEEDILSIFHKKISREINERISDKGEEKYYPFDEGDTYYTIEDEQIIESTWDFVSEEMYDENPNQEYFTSHKSASEWLSYLKKF